MELKLHILADKTLGLHHKINNIINEHSFNLCSHCSNHGRYCIVADSSPDERARLIAISDSLKELHTLILSLEKVRSNHKKQRDEALGRIKESREVVRERARRCSKEERENEGVIAELIEFVGDGKESDGFLWEMDDGKIQQKKSVNGIYRFLVGTARFGLEFSVVFATIYMSLEFARKHKNGGMDDSRMQTQFNGDTEVHLDVLCGRG
ncbi:hypothetical protein SASPL_145620 [Salvia splendens]|uniref:Uncharacterized protein n=1 Tax=Salvia splendens TaxID=180675 RepID=A0A8X8WII5_SALSN|nr:uncharacterized protein LOC121773935 [Salvia splendens]KAG6395029.1 hypothetical protein SASPL_145620 [Salvia splendens]